MGNSISNQIKKLRRKRGWTQAQLADKLNVSTRIYTKSPGDHCTATTTRAR